ncbi:MAG: hypothetical protein ABIL40_09000 [candidate division WOR-3 bacterium]
MLSFYHFNNCRNDKFKNLEQGYYKLNWDGTDDTGRRLSEGVYFLRFDDQTEVKTQKVIIVR